MSLRVLHVSQPVDAGVARVVRELARDQVAAGFEVTVATPPDGPLHDWATAAGARHVAWRAARQPLSGVVGEVRRLSRLIRSIEPDIVHLHSSKAGLIGRLALRGRLPTVFQTHAWSFYAVSGPVRSVALGWERRAAGWSDLVICVSEEERRRGEALGVQARYLVVANGVDLSRFPVAPDGRRAARIRLGLPEQPLVVNVARVARQKAQDVLLAAWAQVAGQVPRARLALVGEGTAELSVEGTPNLIRAGRRDDVETWLAAADVVVVPSRWESMPLAMLEAMAAGRSIVATEVDGVREALLPGAGAIVPVEAPDPLARALTARLIDPALARAEGREARRLAERNHDLSRVVEAVRGAYADVLDRRAAQRPASA